MNDITKLFIDNNINVCLDCEMKDYTTMRVGGKVTCVVTPDNIDQLALVLKLVSENDIDYKILGKGSNSVFSSKDMDIVIIRIANVLNDLEIESDYIKVGAGYNMQTLARQLSKKGFSGLEFAGGIPGTVGGAIFMNAGAHLGDMQSIIISVDYMDEDGLVYTFDNSECQFSYRHSIFQEKSYIILSCKLKITLGDKAEVFKRMSGNLEYRKEMQPLEYPSCGSTFRNPPGEHAGKLIEECGLKGFRIGGVCVSEKHANFVINDQNGTGEEVYELVQHIKDVVYEKTNIKLHSEMEFINM